MSNESKLRRAAAAQPAREISVEELAERARGLEAGTVLLDLKISAFGNRAKIEAGVIGAGADADLIHAHKTLFDSPEIKVVMSHLRRTREEIRSRYSVPSVFRGGMYLTALAVVETVDAYLRERDAELQPLLDALVETLPRAKEQARERLSGITIGDRTVDLYNDDDYPSAAALRSFFSMSWRWCAIETPTAKLDKMNGGGLLFREVEKAKRDVARAVAELTAMMRDEFSKLVEHLIDRLGTREDGKPQRFKDATIRNLREFVEFFDARNVASDKDLAGLVQKTRDLLSGVDPAELRDPDRSATREKVRTAFAKISASVETLPKPRRDFRWE